MRCASSLRADILPPSTPGCGGHTCRDLICNTASSKSDVAQCLHARNRNTALHFHSFLFSAAAPMISFNSTWALPSYCIVLHTTGVIHRQHSPTSRVRTSNSCRITLPTIHCLWHFCSMIPCHDRNIHLFLWHSKFINLTPELLPSFFNTSTCMHCMRALTSGKVAT